MAVACQHTNAVSSDHADSGAHIVYCPDCRGITHACFKPLYDHIEKNLESVRAWGVAVSKAVGTRASDSAAIQREVESVLVNLREAMLMARIEKNEFLERIAQVFEGRGQREVAASVRDLKLEIAIHGEQHAATPAPTA